MSEKMKSIAISVLAAVAVIVLVTVIFVSFYSGPVFVNPTPFTNIISENDKFNKWEVLVSKDDMTEKEEYFLSTVVKTTDDYSETSYIFAEVSCGTRQKEYLPFIDQEQVYPYQDLKFTFSAFKSLDGNAESGKGFKTTYKSLLGGNVTYFEMIDSGVENATQFKHAVLVPEFRNVAQPFLVRKYDEVGTVYMVNPWNNYGVDPKFTNSMRIKFTLENGEKVILNVPVHSEPFTDFFEHCKNK